MLPSGGRGSAAIYLVNKKETEAWFNALGRSTPFGGTKFGFIRSISIADENVKKFRSRAFFEGGGRLSLLKWVEESFCIPQRGK